MLGPGRLRRAGRRQVRVRPVRRLRRGPQRGRRPRLGRQDRGRGTGRRRETAPTAGRAAHAASRAQTVGLQVGPHLGRRGRHRGRPVRRAGRRGRQQGVLGRAAAGAPPPPSAAPPSPAAAVGHRQRPGRRALDQRRVQMAVRRGRRRAARRPVPARRVDVRAQRVHQEIVRRSEFFLTHPRYRTTTQPIICVHWSVLYINMHKSTAFEYYIFPKLPYRTRQHICVG